MIVNEEERADDIIRVENIVGHTGKYFLVRAALTSFLEHSGIAEDISPGEIAQAMYDVADEYQKEWDDWVDENFDEDDCEEGCCHEPVEGE